MNSRSYGRSYGVRRRKHGGQSRVISSGESRLVNGKPKPAKHGPKPAFSFKRQVVPPLIGILVMLGVLAVMNGQYLIAQYNYRVGDRSAAGSGTATGSSQSSGSQSSDSSRPTASAPPTPNVPKTLSPNPERGPYLTIPSIKVEAPIVFEPSYTEWKVQRALRNGVVHYGTTADPGQNGNMVILGHSSGQPWAPGNFKFVFTLLDKVKANDSIIVDYMGTRYTYKVTGTSVAAPTDASVLTPTPRPTLTLITCTPVGTSKKRLIVRAEQISPSIAPASTVSTSSAPQTPKTSQVQNTHATPVAVPQQLPASASASFWDRLREWF